MAIQEQLLMVIESARERELEFIANLTDEERGYTGTYEKWSAKDNIAHANYWEAFRADRITTFLRGDELEPVSPYDQANAESFEQFSGSSWEEVEAFAEDSHNKMVQVVEGMDEEELTGPSAESEERKMWDAVVGNAYTHKLSHYSEFYQEGGRNDEASKLWGDWAELVSPLDPSPEWQGTVHYNAACSLALAGDVEGAFAELKKSLDLRPSFITWSRLDSDLDSLHELPKYRDLFAPSYWWEVLSGEPQKEALAEQYLRALSMFRIAVNTFPPETWLEGDTLYQRPVGMALHIAQSIDFYSALEPGERSENPLTQVNWEDRDSSKLPTQEELLTYLDTVEERLARFITKSDLQVEEKLYPWTGLTILSRALYNLRHTHHHLADMAMELQHRGFKPPDWQ